MKKPTLILGLIIFFIYSCASPENQSQKADEGLKTQRISYKIHKEWVIPNGGYGRVIIVDTSKKNETDLKLLGETLKYDTREDRNAFVFVYDDLKAAELYDRIGKMSKKEESFYDNHFIATYTRNINSGYHKLEMILNGVNSEWKTVDYQAPKTAPKEFREFVNEYLK